MANLDGDAEAAQPGHQPRGAGGLRRDHHRRLGGGGAGLRHLPGAAAGALGDRGAHGELLGHPPGLSRFEKKGLRGFLGGEFEPGQDDQG